MSPVVHVSCGATLRDILAGSGSARDIFAPDGKAKNQAGAKAYLLGFCITLKRDHYYTIVAGVQHMELAGAYQAKFHWHEGEGHLTLDLVSKRNTDASSMRSVSHPFAYHGMTFLMQPVVLAWHAERPRDPTTFRPWHSTPRLTLEDVHSVIHAEFLGVQFTESGDWSLA